MILIFKVKVHIDRLHLRSPFVNLIDNSIVTGTLYCFSQLHAHALQIGNALSRMEGPIVQIVDPPVHYIANYWFDVVITLPS